MCDIISACGMRKRGEKDAVPLKGHLVLSFDHQESLIMVTSQSACRFATAFTCRLSSTTNARLRALKIKLCELRRTCEECNQNAEILFLRIN